MKICINNPYWLNTDSFNNYLGARAFFILDYADGIYFSSKKLFLQWIQKSDYNMIKQIISNKEILFSHHTINRKYDVFITFNNPPIKKYNFHKNIKILKFQAIYDYNFDPNLLNKLLRDSNVDYLIGHAKHDIYDQFFNLHFPTFHNKTIDYQFGFNKSIRKYLNFQKINKIVGLGAIATLSEFKDINELKEYYKHFFIDENRDYSHLQRHYFRSIKNEINDIFDSFFPENGIFKNTKNNEQFLLSKYKYFLNDLGSLNFLPARTFEGIALGIVPIIMKHDLYNVYGFNETNSVIIDSQNVNTIKQKFLSIDSEHYERLSYNSLKLADNFTFEKVNEDLYNKIKSIYYKEDKYE